MDEREAKRLVDSYADMILRISFNYLRQTADAEDICQTVFLKYLSARPRFADAAHEKAWIIRTAVNACKDHRRSAYFRHTVALEEAAAAEAPETADHGLLDAVRELPAGYRLSIYLYYYEGYSVREIAALLGKSESSVAASLSRGRRKLKERLTEEAREGERA